MTGSSRGIGASIAAAFAREGASVVVNCNENVEEARKVVDSISSMGGKAELCIADVREERDALRLAEHALDRFGGIDILVNNAGVSRDSLFGAMTSESWQEVLDTNLTGVFNCCRAVFEPMKGQGRGRIVNISSVVAEAGNIGQVNYAASKAGVIGMTRAMALEFARYGILVNAIAPGFCTTKMVEGIPEPVKEKIIAKIPLKRFGAPEEIAYVALFLASDQCSYMTGQVISVNGGLHL